MSIDPATPEIAFGIGCFHFGILKTPPFVLSGRQYIDEVEKFIEALPNIEYLSIDFDDDFDELELGISDVESILLMRDGGQPFPVPQFGRISFIVRIPHRTQSAILDLPIKYLDKRAEVYSVQIHYPYYWPVAFIEPLDSSGELEPAIGVRIVREFLNREFSKVQSDWIKFDFLGPSPYHVDCYISPDLDDSNVPKASIRSTRTKERGYDRIDFNYQPSEFQDSEEIRELIFTSIEDELSLYYNMMYIRQIRDASWYKIRVGVNELIALQKLQGLSGFGKRFIGSQGKINEIFINLADFSSKDLEIESFFRQEFSTSFTSEPSQVFNNDLEGERVNKTVYPLEDITKLIQFFEDRKNTATETISVINAAIVGGVMGSLITVVLSGGH